jgi:hypothetical protein
MSLVGFLERHISLLLFALASNSVAVYVCADASLKQSTQLTRHSRLAEEMGFFAILSQHSVIQETLMMGIFRFKAV